MKKKLLIKDLLFLVKKSFCCLLIVSSCFLFSTVSLAEEAGSSGEKATQPENDVGFAVEPVQTATQIDSQKGFYFIKVEPNQPQELSIKIRSTNVAPATVSIYVKNAYTNQNGSIDYDSDDYERDATLTDSVEELTSVSEKKVTVKNYEEKIVTISVNPPHEKFSGVKGGTICIMKADSSEEKEGLSSTFEYRIGLLLTEDSEVYDDGSSLNLLKVRSTVHQGKRVIQARMQNPEPKVLKDLMIETKLYKKGSREVIKKRTANNMRMAPNSQFDFSTNWGIDPIKSGTYTLQVRAQSGTNTWEWKKDFTIGEKQAKKINEEASFTITFPEWVPLVTILIGVVSIILIGCLYVRSKKWNVP